MLEPIIQVLPDPAAVARAAAERIAESARQAVQERGVFSVALSGGSTPKALYALLAAEPYRSAVPWAGVEIYFGDERCVPPDSDQSNYRMAHETLLSKVPIPPQQVHRIRGEIEPNDAAMEYGRLLQERFGDGGFDLTLLGMGDDGHTASLFPGTAALREPRHRCVANYVEKLQAWRVTLTAPFINRSAWVMVLVAGADKAQRVRDVLEGPRDPERLPIQLIEPDPGQLLWLLDAAAASMDQ